MIQQAIAFTKNNADFIASQLSDYTAQELLDEYDYMFANTDMLVLVRSLFDDGAAVLSHVVTLSMFYANATARRIDENHFEPVTQL